VRPNQKQLTPLYVYYFLLSDLLNTEINGLQHGASYPAITDKEVLNQTIPLPPLPEQQKIAAVLFKIQKSIEIQEFIIEKTRELKKSTLHHVFTHGLLGEKLKETEIGPIPASWSVQRFGDFAILHRGYDLPIQDRTSGAVPIVGSNGVVGYHDQSKVKGPGVVTGRSGSIGISSYVADDYWPLNTGLYVEDFHGNDPLYVHYFFQSFDFGQYAAGVSVPTLNRNLVHAVLISVPPIGEQMEIAHILKTIDQKIDLHTAKKSTRQDLFKTMLNKLMTGEIRVKDLDIDVSEVSA
jgi:type I restriction enzyme S subunit